MTIHVLLNLLIFVWAAALIVLVTAHAITRHNKHNSEYLSAAQKQRALGELEALGAAVFPRLQGVEFYVVETTTDLLDNLRIATDALAHHEYTGQRNWVLSHFQGE